MRIWTGFFATLILGAASQAHAGLSGWCSGGAKDQSTYVTPVISLPSTSTEDRVSTEDRYTEWLETKTGKSIGISYCYGFESRAEAETEYAASLQHMYGSGVNVTLVSGFTPGSAAPRASDTGAKSATSSQARATTNGGTDGAHKPTGSGPYLTVETDTSLIDARNKQEALELQAQRDQAASLAKRVADTARDRADMQAKLAKFFEELKKRGSAQ